jgi:hypothetical protein
MIVTKNDAIWGSEAASNVEVTPLHFDEIWGDDASCLQSRG